MAKLIDLSKKVKIINCAEEYGAERASSFYTVPLHLVLKWMSNKNDIFEKQRLRAESQRNYIKKRYSEGTLIVKQYKRGTRKSLFVSLAKSLKRNLRKKNLSTDKTPTANELWKLALKQKLKCKYSGIKLNRENISIDHITPLCKGGTSEINNLCFVTKEVNYMKHMMTVDSFLILCKTITTYNKL